MRAGGDMSAWGSAAQRFGSPATSYYSSLSSNSSGTTQNLTINASGLDPTVATELFSQQMRARLVNLR
jgi:hypothetical protein